MAVGSLVGGIAGGVVGGIGGQYVAAALGYGAEGQAIGGAIGGVVGGGLGGLAGGGVGAGFAGAGEDGAVEGGTFPQGLAFRMDLPKHLAGPDGFAKSGLLAGTHNQLNAVAALEAKGATYSLNPTSTQGISELKYTYITDTGKQVLGSKSVYDPAIYSDDSMLNISQNAGQRAYEMYLQNPTQTRFDLTQSGVNVRAYINFDAATGSPYVGNVHPIK